MENGGKYNIQHQPWLFSDNNVIDIYRYFAYLHHELVPYMYSCDVDAHTTGTSIVHPTGADLNDWENYQWEYRLGDNIFVSTIYDENNYDSKTIYFQEGSSWIDYWNDNNVYQGGTTATLDYSIDQYPIFIRSGAIIPMNVDNSITGHGSEFSKDYLTLLIYPDGLSSYQYYTGESTSTQIKCNEGINGFTISLSENTDSIIIRLKNKIEPGYVRLNGNINLAKKNSFSDFEGSSSGWFHGKMADDKNVYTWIKFSDPADTVYVTISCNPDLYPVNYELSNLNEGNEYYVDREYTLTTIPDEYKNPDFYMIKTANDDKTTSNLDFHFNICNAANIYIAYDHRVSPPSWISSNYIETGEKIYVNDLYLEYFSIWERTTQPGIITFGDNEGNEESSMYFVFYKLHEPLYVVVKVLLEGPYGGGDTMHTSLSQNNLIPTSQPYGGSPWNYSGSEHVSNIPANTIDWVLVQLRSDTSTIVGTRAALLKSDGSIVDTDGTSPLKFNGIAGGNYYIVIEHRNHLAVMDKNKVTLPNVIAYDFTTAQTQAYGSNPMSALGDGKFGMISGDGNGNGQIQNNDSENIWKPDNGTAGYKNSDFNLNGQVQNNDNESYWKPNNGRGTHVPLPN